MNAPTGVPSTNNFGFTGSKPTTKPGVNTAAANAAAAKAAHNAAEIARRTNLRRTMGLEESAGAVLNNRAIDSIISAAVQKNYARIVAAQQGRSLSGTPTTNTSSAPSTANTSAVSNPFDNPRKLAADWQAYIAAGGPISGRLKRLINNMNTAAQRSAQPPAAAPTPTATPESVGHSRFLGIQL